MPSSLRSSSSEWRSRRACFRSLLLAVAAVFVFSHGVLRNEGAVFTLSGIGQRCMTKPPSLILRFDSGDPQDLSSVTLLKDLQLNSSKPLVQTPVPSGEPPSGHQLSGGPRNKLKPGQTLNLRANYTTFYLK